MSHDLAQEVVYVYIHVHNNRYILCFFWIWSAIRNLSTVSIGSREQKLWCATFNGVMMEMVNTGPEACSLLRILPCLQYLSSMACPVVLFQHSRSSLQKRHKIIIPSVAWPIVHDRRSWLYSCLQWSYCLWQLWAQSETTLNIWSLEHLHWCSVCGPALEILDEVQ